MLTREKLGSLLALCVAVQGWAPAQPSTGIIFRCVPISECFTILRDPRTGTSIRPAPERFVVQLPLSTVSRVLSVQFIADRAGKIDLNAPEVAVLNSRRFGQSASRLKSLINYRCLRGTSKGGATEYFCRMAK